MSISTKFSAICSHIKQNPIWQKVSSLWQNPILREILITVVMAMLVYTGLNFSLQNSIVVGHSMESNLHDGERVLINKLAYRFWGTPKRGDIIVFEPPGQVSADGDYVKRVIGLPGELVEVRNGHVYITQVDGTEICLDESTYISQPIMGYYKSKEPIPEGHYFVMGDNRNGSSDSRGGWTVAKADIVGKAWLVIWPPADWGLAPNRGVTALAD